MSPQSMNYKKNVMVMVENYESVFQFPIPLLTKVSSTMQLALTRGGGPMSDCHPHNGKCMGFPKSLFAVDLWLREQPEAFFSMQCLVTRFID